MEIINIRNLNGGTSFYSAIPKNRVALRIGDQRDWGAPQQARNPGHESRIFAFYG